MERVDVWNPSFSFQSVAAGYTYCYSATTHRVTISFFSEQQIRMKVLNSETRLFFLVDLFEDRIR